MIISVLYFALTLILSLFGLDSLIEHQDFTEKSKYLITHSIILLLIFLDENTGTAALILIVVYFALRQPSSTDDLMEGHQTDFAPPTAVENCSESPEQTTRDETTGGGNFASI